MPSHSSCNDQHKRISVIARIDAAAIIWTSAHAAGLNKNRPLPTLLGDLMRHKRLLTTGFAIVAFVLCIGAQLTWSQTRVNPKGPLIPANPIDRASKNTPSATTGVVASSVAINAPNPTLTLTDTSTQKDFALRQRAGDLHISSVIRSQINLPGRNIDTSAYADHVTLKPSGNWGIGTQDPLHRLSLVGGPTWTANSWRGAVDLENGAAIAWRANSTGLRYGIGHTNDGLYFFRTGSDPGKTDQAALPDMTIRNDGTVSVKALEITGADLAELFTVRDTLVVTPRSAGRAGLVVSIDADTPGSLEVSDRPYDQRVAGVISGAKNIGPGMILGKEMATGEHAHAVALSGRVYVWADASAAPIAPGDLLTTSPIPGHAMKVVDASRAQGAVLGKAMSKLESGTGLVLVLVSLQ